MENYLYDTTLTSAIFTIIILMIIVVKCLIIPRKDDRIDTKVFDKISSLLMEAIIRGKIQNAKDAEDFVKGSDEIAFLGRIPFTLKDVLLRTKYYYINSRSYDTDEPLKQINDIIKEVEIILQLRQLSSPFDGVPLQERDLLTDILELSQKKEEQVFRDKVYHLAALVRAREEALVKSGKDNEESLKIGKQSKYIGIISLILAVLVIAIPWIISLFVNR